MSDEFQRFLKAYPDTKLLELLQPDMNGVFRGKRLPIDEAAKLFDGGVNYCASSVVMDTKGEAFDSIFYGNRDGDPDVMGHPVAGSLVPVPWADQPIGQVMLRLSAIDGSPYFLDPRVVLENALKPLQDMGLKPVVATELEFYLLDEVADTHGRPQPPLSPLTGLRDELPIDVVQLDDGYQRAVGDWLETNEKFPSGLERLAREIRTAGFVPGLWTAPFCAVPESRLHQDRPHWLLRHGSELHRGLVHGVWAREGWVHVLDTSREDVLEHLRAVFASLVEMGFTYLKLDFLYVVAMQADAADPSLTRAARLRQGLEAIRRGAGDDAFLLGCGCPMGPAVGIVDGMRIGPDVAPSWEIEDVPRIPGIEATQPSTRNAVRNVLARAWMHRRLWLNDPDCLMTRSDDTRLSADERRTLAAVVAASGGMTIFSDDVPRLSEESRHLVRDTVELARAVDRSGRRGTARARGLLLDEMPSGLHARAGSASLLAWVNHTDSPESPAIDLPEHDGFRSEALLGTVPVATQEGRRTIPPHATSLVRYDRPVRLAVFCDFDGTFAVQDVGATLARRHAGDRRPALWARLERGELSAWEYNLELLDGLELPKAVLEDFLRSVELSPGADELVRWCESHGVPFRVLSDGFDYNLDRLQEIHQIRFEYEANRLRYEGGSWRIEAGFPNPSCSCGTGTCKRGRIETFRREHPGASVVHIGNGRVSDLCAALASDVVFAKDTLADELVDRGVPFEPFDTLRDVLPVLERLLAASSTSES